jgi:hypothetical protein
MRPALGAPVSGVYLQNAVVRSRRDDKKMSWESTPCRGVGDDEWSRLRWDHLQAAGYASL